MELSFPKLGAHLVLHQYQLSLSWQFKRFPTFVFIIFIFVITPGSWCGFSCMENPCMHGICIDSLEMNSSYDCYCINGFTGYSCQINWDECRSNPCLNGGSCVDGIASFNCSCPENFAGTFCEVDLSACEESLVCQNNGTCVGDSRNISSTGFKCACLQGFTGEQCEIDISVCNSTESMCQNGGKCVDGPGARFHCQCQPGWSGENCHIDIDECESNPCMAGGICVNKINDFSCACPFGYTGRTCETKLRICEREENPCLNGAFCLHESEDNASEKTCYCVPDYHGTLCELRYDDCDPPPKCFNGGTCVDGVGEFSCSCPEDFFGPTCQCTAHNATEPECLQSKGTIFASETVTATLSFHSTMLLQPDEMLSSIHFSPAPTVQLIPSSDIPIMPLPSEMYSATKGITEFATPSLAPSTSVFDSSQGMGRDDIGMRSFSDSLPSLSIVHTDYLSHLPKPTQTLNSVEILQSSLMPPGETVVILESSKPFVLESSEEDTLPSTTPFLPGTVDYSTFIQVTPTISFSSIFQIPSPSIDIVSVVSISEPHLGGDGIIPTAGLTADLITTATVSDLVEGEQTEGPKIMQSSRYYIETALLPKETESPEVSDTTSQELFISPYTDSGLMITPAPTVLQSYNTVLPSTPDISKGSMDSIDLMTSLFQSDLEFSSKPFPFTDKLVPPEGSGTASFGGAKISDHVPHTPYSELVSATDIVSTIITYFASSSIMRPPFEGDYDSVTTEIVSSSLLTPTLPKTTTPTTEDYLSQKPYQNQTDSCYDYCSNNSPCIANSIEPICLCSFRFAGDRCEIPREKFISASFTGNSYLSYRVPNDSSISKVHLKSKLVTIVPEGTLLYTGSGRMYALIFLQGGHVTLHFSCGSQSMHFVETRTRVDNGFNFTLDFRIEMIIQGVNLYRCSAEVSVNQSYVMKGEQIVGKEGVTFPAERPIDKFFLGGVPTLNTDAVKNDELVGILPGFRGCLHKLMINQEQRDIYDDAVDGKEVEECKSFSCVANPCHGSARCLTTHVYPFWECLCPPGFQGHRCQLIICVTNPCQNGATCTYSEDSLEYFQSNNLTDAGPDPYGLTASTTAVSLREQLKPICLCRYGFTGSKCQQKINITKPAFYPVGGYASFISYDQIPRFSDWFQLKFHFVTKNISQISILLYTGNERGVRPIKTAIGSHFRLTYQRNNFSLSPTALPVHSGFADFHPEPISDFFSITFLHGFIALTWNLGSGTQRITTPSRIDNRLNIHTLFAGRSGRQAWLKVDGMRNVSGKSPGPLYRLNSNPNELYIGGYKTYKFEGLSHDLPLHQGFQGCIFDLGFRLKNRLYLPKPVKGRNVKNCFEELC